MKIFSSFLIFYAFFERLFKPSLEKKFNINNEIVAARYPEIFKKGGNIRGRAIKIFNEGFIFS